MTRSRRHRTADRTAGFSAGLQQFQDQAAAALPAPREAGAAER
ncbi:hypothetical protein [Streptomyces sp. DSM 118148]